MIVLEERRGEKRYSWLCRLGAQLLYRRATEVGKYIAQKRNAGESPR